MMQSALQRLRISRHGPVTQLIVDGQGAAVVLTADFNPVQKWAQAKPAAPNGNLSMQKILEKLDVAVARPGTTFCSTRGSTKPLSDLVKAMKTAGFDVNEWAVSDDIKNPPPELGSPEWKEAQEEKKKKEAEKEAKTKAVLTRLDEAAKYKDPQGNP